MPCARGLAQLCVASAVEAQHARDVLAFRTHRMLASVKSALSGLLTGTRWYELRTSGLRAAPRAADRSGRVYSACVASTDAVIRNVVSSRRADTRAQYEPRGGTCSRAIARPRSECAWRATVSANTEADVGVAAQQMSDLRHAATGLRVREVHELQLGVPLQDRRQGAERCLVRVALPAPEEGDAPFKN